MRCYYVDCCDVCPNNDEDSDIPKCKRTGRDIPDDTSIPEWCPLPSDE